MNLGNNSTIKEKNRLTLKFSLKQSRLTHSQARFQDALQICQLQGYSRRGVVDSKFLVASYNLLVTMGKINEKSPQHTCVGGWKAKFVLYG